MRAQRPAALDLRLEHVGELLGDSDYGGDL